MPGRSPRISDRTPCEVWQLAHSKKASCSTSLMTRSPSAGSMKQVGRVLDRSTAPDEPSQLVDEVGRNVALPRLAVRLPSDEPDSTSRADALLAQDLGKRLRSVPRLHRQAEVLEPMPSHRQRARRRPCPSTRCRPGSPGHPRGRSRAAPPRSAGRSRSGTTGWRCARDRRRRRARSRPRDSARSRSRSSRAAWVAAGISGMTSGIPKSGSVTCARRGTLVGEVTRPAAPTSAPPPLLARARRTRLHRSRPTDRPPHPAR